MLRSVTKVYTFEIRVYTFTLYIYKVLNMKESKNMTGYGTQVKGMNLYNKAKKDGLNRQCLDDTLRLKSPFHRDNSCSIFAAAPRSSGGGSSILPLVVGGLAVGATALTVGAMIAGSSDSKGPQGAGGAGASSKATLQALQTAGDSTNPDAIQRAIDSGKENSKGLGADIQAAQTAADKAKADIDSVQGKIGSKKTDITKLEQDIDTKEGQVSGNKSSSALTSTRDGEIAKVPKQVPGPDGKMIDNLNYQTDVDAIHTKYDEQIKNAQDVEAEIPKLKEKLEKEKQTLKTYEDVLTDKQKELEASLKQVQELTPKQKQIDAEVIKLTQRLRDVQNATKPDGATAPATADAPAKAAPQAVIKATAPQTSEKTETPAETPEAKETPPTITTISDADFTKNLTEFKTGFNTTGNDVDTLKTLSDNIDAYSKTNTGKLTPAQEKELETLKTDINNKVLSRVASSGLLTK